MEVAEGEGALATAAGSLAVGLSDDAPSVARAPSFRSVGEFAPSASCVWRPTNRFTNVALVASYSYGLVRSLLLAPVPLVLCTCWVSLGNRTRDGLCLGVGAAARWQCHGSRPVRVALGLATWRAGWATAAGPLEAQVRIMGNTK